MGPNTKRPSGPRQMGSRGKGPWLGGGSGGELGVLAGSPQSRLWRRLGAGEPRSFSLATLSGLPEPGAELGKDRSGPVVRASPCPRNHGWAWRGLVHSRAELGKQVSKDPHGGGGRHRQPWSTPRLGSASHPHLPPISAPPLTTPTRVQERSRGQGTLQGGVGKGTVGSPEEEGLTVEMTTGVERREEVDL